MANLRRAYRIACALHGAPETRSVATSARSAAGLLATVLLCVAGWGMALSGVARLWVGDGGWLMLGAAVVSVGFGVWCGVATVRRVERDSDAAS